MFLVECKFDVFSFLLKSVAYALSLFEKLPTVNKQLQGKKRMEMLIEQHNFFSLIRSNII